MNDIDARKQQFRKYLGKVVTVKIDRPVGARHPKRPWIIYPINYGYIEGEIAPDGEELDVYVLGESGPLESATGRIIAIVHRENDVEDKLVMATDGKPRTAEEIARAVHFQEQFYKSHIEVILP